ALDAQTGCVYWSHEAQGQVRSGVTIGDAKGTPGVRYAAYFGDYRGNVYAVNAETGERLWAKRVDTHEVAKITSALMIDPTGQRPLARHRHAVHRRAETYRKRRDHGVRSPTRQAPLVDPHESRRSASGRLRTNAGRAADQLSQVHQLTRRRRVGSAGAGDAAR